MKRTRGTGNHVILVILFAKGCLRLFLKCNVNSDFSPSEFLDGILCQRQKLQTVRNLARVCFTGAPTKTKLADNKILPNDLNYSIQKQYWIWFFLVDPCIKHSAYEGIMSFVIDCYSVIIVVFWKEVPLTLVHMALIKPNDNEFTCQFFRILLVSSSSGSNKELDSVYIMHREV